MDGLSLTAILRYIGDKVRCISEGEQVFKANHVISCGKLDAEDDVYHIWALCLKTSALTESPHEIDVKITSNEVKQVKCSCKAGLSGSCKHGIAVLLLLNSINLEELENVSCTDTRQKWGKLDAARMYGPKKVSEFCCVKSPPLSSIDVSETVCDRLLASVPNSALALHKRRTRQPLTQTVVRNEEFANDSVGRNDDVANDFISFKDRALINHGRSWKFLGDIATKSQALCSTLPEGQRLYYDRQVNLSDEQCMLLCKNTKGQNCALWKSARSIRITASECYGLFTYSKNANADWEKKIKSLLNKTFAGNRATKFGNENESVCLELYQKVFNCSVELVGILVLPDVPWLGMSPDGIVFDENDVPIKLIEIKCSLNGDTLNFTDLVKCKKLPFVKFVGCDYVLNRKHKYYSQCQIGMALSNVDLCDFVIYIACTKTIKVINVERDDEFVTDLISRLCSIYFDYLLPQLVKK